MLFCKISEATQAYLNTTARRRGLENLKKAIVGFELHKFLVFQHTIL